MELEVVDHLGFMGQLTFARNILTQIRTLDVHLELEERIAEFLGAESAILYSQGTYKEL